MPGAMPHSQDSNDASSVSSEERPEAWDDWEEDESEGYKSLFGEERFGSLEEVLAHDKAAHGFGLRAYRAQHDLDQIGTIRLINYIRTAVAAGADPRPALAAAAACDAAVPWQDDRYLQPVQMDDELMFHDWEDEEEEEAAAAGAAQAGAGTGAASGTAAGGESAALRAENEALRSMLEVMRGVALSQEGGALAELVAEVADGSGDGAGGAVAAGAAAGGDKGKAPADEAAQRIDDSYFDSYSTFDIHRDMLADKVRTDAYRDALERNPRLLAGARVLDVGCGTGILSMFAARGGAATVVGIDGSEQIARFAQANVAANGLAAEAGGPITVVSSKVEELAALPLPAAPIDGAAQQQPAGTPPPPPPQEQQDGAQPQAQHPPAKAPPEQQVDVLVSEWMGYALLFESMLGSVLYARDRWLRPGGAVLPDVARVYLAAGSEGASGLNFWRNVYGFSMESVRESLMSDALRRAIVRPVLAQHVISEPTCVQSFDLATMKADDQDFTASFRLTVGAGPQACHSLVLWFDTLFSERFCEHPVELSTSPMGPQTHWVQTVLLLKQPVVMAPAALTAAEGDAGGARAAVALTGQLSMARSRQTHRSLDIVLRYAARYADGSAGEDQVVCYGMGVES
ncbi:putative arginine N-methyltransferase 3 isoform A [Micractinium conductrix]|uniref:type I protein arginine methyltransferase n=1 Tax=Micractinium conductrix TaxID=554055 RepID=A0A2P6VFH2_9CHLO|nr:putative arginine N-methyltransferase 3 isoform A [Micractinium conductrix]|eukprot:PSC72845.1 putative arginine N-methyltransferase 3 isoform A [Micractinium conductrix]